MSSRIEELDANGEPLSSAPVLYPAEAERYVEELTKFTLEDVGSSTWMQQHERIEKLNLQCHQSAMAQSDEFVLEAILTFNKLDTLVHDLLIIEAWKEFVFPEIVEHLVGRNSMRLYFILYHEATIINMIEILMYHKHFVESGGERILEIVDYVARKMTRLNGGYDFRTVMEEPTAPDVSDAKEFEASLTKKTPMDDIMNHKNQIEYRVCISACAIGRFICEHADNLPLSVVSRVADTHDLLMLFIPLIENPPWTRRVPKTGKWQKLIDFKWQEVKPIDLLKITKLEGQPWIALYHLLAKQIFRERYHINAFRKGQILRVRKYLNEIMLDQLPFLVDMQRYMDELAISEVREPSESSNSIFMFQQVSIVREKIIKNKNWSDVANYQMSHVFTMTDRDDKDLKRMADLYADDAVENVLEPLETTKDGYAGNDDLEDISNRMK